MKKTIYFLLCLLLLVSAGCSSLSKRTKCICEHAATGAALGAAVGAGIGHQGDQDSAEGAAIGAGVGGVVGGAVGLFRCRADEADSDGDGVSDSKDKCPGTPAGVAVDAMGCPKDADGDGVPDYKDKCPGTPAGVAVDAMGCPKDTDGDGVPDYKDKCPGTPAGVAVDAMGCPKDADGDGVPDYKDKCPKTPKGAKVNTAGCWILKGVWFDTDKADIKPGMEATIIEAVQVLKQNPGLKVQIQGHTDNIGNASYNQKLSEKRAESVRQFFLKNGIAADRLSATGYGLTQPVATNDTEEGRAQNRRVQIKPIN